MNLINAKGTLKVERSFIIQNKMEDEHTKEIVIYSSFIPVFTKLSILFMFASLDDRPYS